MRKSKKEKDSIVFLLNFIISVLVVVVIVTGIRLYFALDFMREPSYFVQKADFMAHRLERADYAYLIQGKYVNESVGYEGNRFYHALAEYIEATSLEKVYTEKGYTERADKQKKIKEEARKKMGNLIIFTEKIDKLFQ